MKSQWRNLKYGAYAWIGPFYNYYLSAYAILSEPDENMVTLKFGFCPDTISVQKDRVPYQYWADKGYIIATPGNVIDYFVISDIIKSTFHEHKVIRLEYDRYNATQLIQELQEDGLNVSEFSQAIGTISAPTKEFENSCIP
jgi:phage terminase large subunit-like protein